jgi:dienelactone hydrolase
VDVKFVIDQLVGGHVWKLGHLIDKRTIGMAGHSIGGAAAASAMQADPRIRAGVNIDGAFHPAVPAGALGGRAFMMFGRDEDHTGNGGDPSWDETWADLGGYKRWFAVAGASHAAFTDITMLAQEAGIPIPGTLDAFRGSQITRAYVTAFFDRTLKGCAEPLLDGSSAAYPEVEVQP